MTLVGCEEFKLPRYYIHKSEDAGREENNIELVQFLLKVTQLKLNKKQQFEIQHISSKIHDALIN
jgi:hypothetical protein